MLSATTIAFGAYVLRCRKVMILFHFLNHNGPGVKSQQCLNIRLLFFPLRRGWSSMSLERHLVGEEAMFVVHLALMIRKRRSWRIPHYTKRSYAVYLYTVYTTTQRFCTRIPFPDSVSRFRRQILSQATQNSPVLSPTGIGIGQLVTALRCQADMRQGGVH
jgi:hypothetical protein